MWPTAGVGQRIQYRPVPDGVPRGHTFTALATSRRLRGNSDGRTPGPPAPDPVRNPSLTGLRYSISPAVLGQPSGRQMCHIGVIMEAEHRIIRDAIDGDEAAMRQLWSRHAPHIDVVVRRLVGGDHDLAADVAQEVWTQIFRALPVYRGEAQFSTWAHRIAVNRTLNALRARRRLDALERAVSEMDTDRSFLAASIEAAAEQLSPGARTVFVLHDVEGYTHEEIAEQEQGTTRAVTLGTLRRKRKRTVQLAW